ncbi:MAG: 3-hydroxyacyl-ACP dehydratase FabZ family protein [Thermoguttaceae bacterium]
MPKKTLIIDPSEYDLNSPIAGIEEIRRYNHQRYEMEHLTAIVFEDPVRNICVGYKDLGPDEFWIRGHMPGMPLMPGVIMCEAAAQLTSYFTCKHTMMAARVVGFGGLKDVRFRGIVKPGERFVVQARLLKIRSQMLTCEFQCLVRDEIVCDGNIIGIPLPDDFLKTREPA